MAAYTPTIIVNNTPGLQISMAGNLTYDEFINSLGQYVYSIARFRLEASSINQLLQPMGYATNDATGAAFGYPIIMNPDPYQSRSSIHEDISDNPILLNGQSSVATNFLAGGSMTLIMDADQIGPIDGFADLGDKPNRNMADDNMGNLKLYDEFDLFLN